MSSERVSFSETIEDVELEVEAVIYDGEIDEFTVSIGDNIVTEILSDSVIEKLQEKAFYEASDEMKQLTKADDEWKEKQ